MSNSEYLNGLVYGVWSSNPGPPNLTKDCKRFASCSTSTKEAAVLRHVKVMGEANLLVRLFNHQYPKQLVFFVRRYGKLQVRVWHTTILATIDCSIQ